MDIVCHVFAEVILTWRGEKSRPSRFDGMDEKPEWNWTSGGGGRKKQEVSGRRIMGALKWEIRRTGCKGGPKVRAHALLNQL